MLKKIFFFLFFSFGLCVPYLSWSAPIQQIEIIDSIIHNNTCYTQGLFFYKDALYESCGRYGESKLSRYNLTESDTLVEDISFNLSNAYFAEGATIAHDKIYLLTWQENTGFIVDAKNLTAQKQFNYSGEGWGLAYAKEELWRSDGTAKLYPHSINSFAPAGEPIIVRVGTQEIAGINELEWDAQLEVLFANVYGEDIILAINLDSGQVEYILDASPVRERAIIDGLDEIQSNYDIVLNGLAIDERGLWVTGKYWPRMYLIKWDFSK